jgi:hypothetical protein
MYVTVGLRRGSYLWFALISRPVRVGGRQGTGHLSSVYSITDSNAPAVEMSSLFVVPLQWWYFSDFKVGVFQHLLKLKCNGLDIFTVIYFIHSPKNDVFVSNILLHIFKYEHAILHSASFLYI